MSRDPHPLLIGPAGGLPGSRLPLLVWRSALASGEAAPEAFLALFARHGWGRGWTDGIYDYPHFHSTAHDVLGIGRGRVTVQFGGEGGPEVALEAGDAVAIPAGVAHCNKGQSADLVVVGAYDRDRAWDVRRGDPAELPLVEAAIAEVPAPRQDPVAGPDGALTRLWAGVPETPPGVA
jgi:uncharacterized protein YjlB